MYPNKTVLRRNDGRIYGYLYDKGHIIEARNYDGVVLGRYEKKEDATVNARGIRVGRGNTLMMLFQG